MSSIDVDRVYSSFFISRDYFVSGFSFSFTICTLLVKQDQTGLVRSPSREMKWAVVVKGWAYGVPGGQAYSVQRGLKVPFTTPSPHGLLATRI